MTMKISQMVDTSTQDREWVEKFEHQVGMLAGMVIEMAEDNKQLLLSPVFRELLVDKAKLVKGLLSRVHRKLVVDNPGNDLEWP